jgi:hypothetical protein
MKLSVLFLAGAVAQLDDFRQKTANPTPYPTAFPTPYPTKFPTGKPTSEPTNSPTTFPTPEFTEPCKVKLYRDCFYSGYVGTFGHGNQYASLDGTDPEGGFFNQGGSNDGHLKTDKISSVQVTGNCAVMLYDQKNYAGDSKVVTTDAACLVDLDGSGDVGDYFNDKVSSFKVASLFMDAKDSPITTTIDNGVGRKVNVEVGNKWVSSKDYANQVVVLKNLPYVLVKNQGITSIGKFIAGDEPVPTHLDSRATYNDLAYANWGLDNSAACAKCKAYSTWNGVGENRCDKIVCKGLGQSETCTGPGALCRVNKGNGINVDGEKMESFSNDEESFKGENLHWAYNGLTARLVKPLTGKKVDDVSYDAVVTYNGKEVYTTIKGSQFDWKKGAERSALTGSQEANTAASLESTSLNAKGKMEGCKVTLYDECDYKGTYHQFYPGHYPDSNGELNIKSVKIEGNCAIRLYDSKNFGGQEKEFTASAECIDATLLEQFNDEYRLAVEGSLGGAGDKLDVNGKSIFAKRKIVAFGGKQSLRVLSLDLDHFDYPTPFPTSFPTASPTFDLDMPDCPVTCDYDQFSVKAHKIHVRHDKTLLKKWNLFRASYPYETGKGPIQGQHTCWHEMPNGLDERQIKVGAGQEKGSDNYFVNQDKDIVKDDGKTYKEGRIYNKDIYNGDHYISTKEEYAKLAADKAAGEEPGHGGCICRCN